MQRLQGKVAIITGVGSGIGRASAELFAREGAHVVGCARSSAAGEDLAATTAAAGNPVSFVQADISEPADVSRIVAAAVEVFGRVDILVNNASVLRSAREAQVGTFGMTHEIALEDWDEVFRVNIGGVFMLTKAVLPHMLTQRQGVILNIGSNASLIGFSVCHPYSASKGAMTSYSRALAKTYGPNGIRVNTMIAGGCETPMMDDFLPLFRPVLENPQTRYSWSPLGRLATPQELAPTVLFLCSEESSFIHGADIVVDGGQAMNAAPGGGELPIPEPAE